MKDDAAFAYELVGDAYEKHRHLAEVSPSWLATIVMHDIEFPRELHDRGYRLSHLQLRQVARKFCAKKLDPVESITDDDLFPETLQHRYPRCPRETDEEPKYVLLNELTDEDVQYNVMRLRKEASAKLRHADALEAWGRQRRAS